MKKREQTKPCNILVSNIEMIKKCTKGISEIEEEIIKRFFPGALTVILKKNHNISDTITAHLDTIGIRMPNNRFLLELIEMVRKTDSCDKFKFIRRKK